MKQTTKLQPIDDVINVVVQRVGPQPGLDEVVEFGRRESAIHHPPAEERVLRGLQTVEQILGNTIRPSGPVVTVSIQCADRFPPALTFRNERSRRLPQRMTGRLKPWRQPSVPGP
ncbi:hypothetical protein DVS28_a0337 [Euzebya pacifica]|uniref:Uncharacterized protein n=1 Tax=Euzebya pacifica TaxID=1608957 RepID=A0A346XS47_9ACTN|nr:hypothetical protein DVS28_a0337 [Euzebya pacifica]